MEEYNQNKEFTNVFLLEGSEENSRSYVGKLLKDNFNLNLNKENVDISLVDCGDLDSKKLKELLAGVILKPRGIIKAYIFLKGEELSTIMQNSMLKIFEEPPNYAFFAILCENAGSIIQTLRSRCSYVYTGSCKILGDETQSNYLNIISYFYEENIGALFQELKTINKRDMALDFIKSYLNYLDMVDENSKKIIFETKFNIVLPLEKARRLIEANANFTASMEAMALNIMEVLGDYSSRDKI